MTSVLCSAAAAFRRSASAAVHTSSTSAGAFVNQRTAKELWKASTSVSSVGRQRGRQKGLMRAKNLNIGQKLGFGPARMVWPGLTQPAFQRDRQVKAISKMSAEEFTSYEDGVVAVRNAVATKRGIRRRQTPLERGWTSASPRGRKFGPPASDDPATDFSGFESILVEQRMSLIMTGNFGRVRRINMLMVTGNGRGLAGFAGTKTPTGKGASSLKKVKYCRR